METIYSAFNSVNDAFFWMVHLLTNISFYKFLLMPFVFTLKDISPDFAANSPVISWIYD